MIESLWTPEGRRSASRSTPMSAADWERFVSFTPVLQTPGVTIRDSPSVGTIPWTLSPPTSAMAQGLTVQDVSDYAAGLREVLRGRQDVTGAGVGDRGKAPMTETSHRDDSGDSSPPPLPVVVGVGTSGAGPSSASSSYTVPEVPKDIMYYDGIRQVPYRILDVSVGADLLGSLAGVPPDTVNLHT